MADKDTLEKVGEPAEKSLSDSPKEQRDDSSIDSAPKGPVLSTDEAIEKIERS